MGLVLRRGGQLVALRVRRERGVVVALDARELAADGQGLCDQGTLADLAGKGNALVTQLQGFDVGRRVADVGS